jgi:hypothetical protein
MDLGCFFGKSWTPKRDVQAFAGILLESVFRASAEQRELGALHFLLVSRIIERKQWRKQTTSESFAGIWPIQKGNSFKIMEDIDMKEVSDFSLGLNRQSC